MRAVHEAPRNLAWVPGPAQTAQKCLEHLERSLLPWQHEAGFPMTMECKSTIIAAITERPIMIAAYLQCPSRKDTAFACPKTGRRKKAHDRLSVDSRKKIPKKVKSQPPWINVYNIYLFYYLVRYFMFPRRKVSLEQIFQSRAVVDCSRSSEFTFRRWQQSPAAMDHLATHTSSQLQLRNGGRCPPYKFGHAYRENNR